MNPYHHALSSAEKYGGQAEDYLAIHQWFDESKAFLPDFRHRALRHHAEGIFLAERIFGVTLTNSAGRVIPTRFIGEQHVNDDLRRIPTVQDWLACITPKPWMMRTGRVDITKCEPTSRPATKKTVVNEESRWFRNHYQCLECSHVWNDEWSATCDDDCPRCAARHISPVRSEDVIPSQDSEPQPTLACDGCGDFTGVRIDVDPGCSFDIERPAGFAIIERCDTCDRFPDDLTAAKSVADHAHWTLCADGHKHAIGLPHAKPATTNTDAAPLPQERPPVGTPITVRLQSEEFGAEDFQYDDLETALHAVRRLYRECLKPEDQVQRQISLLIGSLDE